MELADLQAQLVAIKAAKATGVLTVRHGDTQTTYRSLDEMDRVIADLTAEINALSGTTRKPRYIRQPRKGY
jgi:hypothetical protein